MLKFLENIFGKNNGNADKPSASVPMDIQFGKQTDKEVGELLKKATALKKTNLEQAILLIKQALKIDPDYPCYDKLKNYLVLANKMEEAEELILKLIDESKGNDSLYNFGNRAGNYDSYSGLLFKRGLYKEYIYYYCLSIYNCLVADTISEQFECVKVNLNSLKNKKIFTDKKTNKAFQEIGASVNQDLFIKTFYEILKSFNFNELYKLVTFLNNRQSNKEALEIYAFENGKEDWLLWSNQQFQQTIPLYYEELFVEKYNGRLEVILNQNG